MPTYTVTTVGLDLGAAEKQAVAAAITNAHSAATGAPGYFAQVIFNAAAPADHFIGGQPSPSRQVFVHGLIRAGRTEDAKRALIETVIARLSVILSISTEDCWVYLQDIAATQMAEFGRILPEPGEEAAWTDAVSEEKRAQLRAAGIVLPGEPEG